MKDENGNSKCFGFVNFQRSDSAVVAVERLNGTTTNDGKVLFVRRAQRKTEREAELKAKLAQAKLKRYDIFLSLLVLIWLSILPPFPIFSKLSRQLKHFHHWLWCHSTATTAESDIWKFTKPKHLEFPFSSFMTTTLVISP
ncbi:polyadenylate-binding protein [Trifolium repens]|nr:polyadenylate-binding protein [Trifolium repens]